MRRSPWLRESATDDDIALARCGAMPRRLKLHVAHAAYCARRNADVVNRLGAAARFSRGFRGGAGDAPLAPAALVGRGVAPNGEMQRKVRQALPRPDVVGFCSLFGWVFCRRATARAGPVRAFYRFFGYSVAGMRHPARHRRCGVEVASFATRMSANAGYDGRA